VALLAAAAGTSSCAFVASNPSTGSLCDGPRGSRAQLKTPIMDLTGGPRMDEPVECAEGSGDHHGAYLRVYGQGSRRIVMGSEAEARACVPPPGAPPEVCPEVGAMRVAATVAGRLKARGIEINGIGAGVCAWTQGLRYDSWRYSVGIVDWKDADAAVAVVHEVLQQWDIGDHFGISVRGMNCDAELT
jgi:hypothetical protein